MIPTYFKRNTQYFPIRQEEKIEASEDIQSSNAASFATIKVCEKTFLFNLKYLLWISWGVILCLILSNLYTWRKFHYKTEMSVFSPASSVIRYKSLVPTSGIRDGISPYQGPPSESNNKLWEDLYSFGISRIPMSEASQLVNRTVPITDDPGYYAVTLEVFHQLHCLNMIRHQIWSSVEAPGKNVTMSVHIDHCIDSIRQTLMCASDITPMPFAWYLEYQVNFPVFNTLHTCRDFDAIRKWAQERQSFTFNTTIHEEDPLGNNIIE